MKRKIFYAICFFSITGIANSQEKNSKYVNGESNYDSWSLSGYLGPSSIYTGDLRTDEAAFKFGIAGEIGATKWFNHGFGVETLLQFGKTRQTNATPNTSGNTTYLGLSFNGMLNLNSVFRRGDLIGERKWNAYAYAGIGIMDFTSKVTNTITNRTTEFKNDAPWRSIYVQGGAILSRKLNDKFDISARANFLLSGRDMFDGVESTKHANAQEQLLTATIGITYHFGKKEKLVWSDPLDYKLKNALANLKLTNTTTTKSLDSVANVALNKGTLDQDKDGVLDAMDKCPTIKGKKENGGCPEMMNTEKIINNILEELVTEKSNASIKPKYYNKLNKVVTAFRDNIKNILDDLNFNLEGINFDTNKAIIKPEYFNQLNEAAKTLNSNKDKKFIIYGYTDCLGNFSSNQILSEKRALSIRNYLIERGVSSSQLQAVGKGENSPLNTCTPCNSCSKIEHDQNRRIEFKLVK